LFSSSNQRTNKKIIGLFSLDCHPLRPKEKKSSSIPTTKGHLPERQLQNPFKKSLKSL
jgi:hypothetical protein